MKTKDQMKQEINEMTIAQQIKTQLENSNINVVILHQLCLTRNHLHQY